MFRKCFLTLTFLIVTCSEVVAASSDIVYDLSDDKIVKSANPYEQRPVASLTKLMTALVVVESSPAWKERVTYKGHIWPNKKVTKLELLESLLIKSDNLAAEALADAWPGGRMAFISAMNAKAQQLKMYSTSYEDPSGLGKSNISTVTDQSILVMELSKYPMIKEISTSKFLEVESRTKQKIRKVHFNNTNQRLLFEFDNIILSKTGFTNPAGRCLALLVQKGSHTYAIVILGEKTPLSRENQARHLISRYVTIVEPKVENDGSGFYLLNF
jgi:D-alanyl-D-alanine endopeptidase (penicillin-binding protein 7)